MNTPKHLLGYERLVSNSESSHYRNSTFLSLFIMVQPPLHHPEPIKVGTILRLMNNKIFICKYLKCNCFILNFLSTGFKIIFIFFA